MVGDDAKRLFRQLARLIHPDLAGDAQERERRTNLMVAANDAYEQGDVAALERLLEDWHASPEAVTGSGAAAELERTLRRIAQVEASMRRIDEELAELDASAMGWLRRRVEKATREGWDLLAHMVRSWTARSARPSSSWTAGRQPRERGSRAAFAGYGSRRRDRCGRRVVGGMARDIHGGPGEAPETGATATTFPTRYLPRSPTRTCPRSCPCARSSALG